MPFIEIPSSTQDLSYDSDGYMHLSRVFKLWGVNPLAFYKDPTVIEHASLHATPPVNDKMPAYGDVVVTTNGPNVLTAEGGASGVDAKVTLYEYVLQPTSGPGGIVYMAIARYSNDPRRTPMGAEFSTTQQAGFAPIPYVRKVTVLGGSNAIAYIESTYQAPMAIERVSHSVCLPRKQFGEIERAIARNVRAMHIIPFRSNMFARFDGADLSMRGVQWVQVRYHWTYEFGVEAIDPDDVKVVDKDDRSGNSGQLIFPPATLPIHPIASNTTKYILPPYHTVEMEWNYETTSPYTKKPVWRYRFPQRHNGTYDSLPGREKFLW